MDLDWDWHWFVVPGSALCVLPLAALVGLLLMRVPAARAPVMRWWCAVAAGVALVAASKMAFYGWGVGVRAWDLTCFSGHTVLAFSLWPVLAAVAVPPRKRRWRWLATAAGVGFALLIGLSRIALDAHPPSEVIAGTLLGGAVALASLRALRGQWLAPDASAAVALLLCGLFLALAWTDLRFPRVPSEHWLARAATAVSGRQAPWSRKAWPAETPLSPDVEAARSR